MVSFVKVRSPDYQLPRVCLEGSYSTIWLFEVAKMLGVRVRVSA